MYTPVIVRRGRTTKIQVNVGRDISADGAGAFTSKIRAEKEISSVELAEWQVSFKTDGTDGLLVLTIDDAVSAAVTRTNGYMDMRGVSAGEPYSVWDDPLPVVFEGVVT